MKKENSLIPESIRKEAEINKSFSIRFADSIESLEVANKIWSAVYKEELSWLPKNSKQTVYHDAYHEYSRYMLAYVDGKPAGLMRLVHNSDVGFPVNQFVATDDMIKEENASAIECQRLLVLPEYREARSSELPFGIWPAFMKATLQYCLRYSIGYMLADCFLYTPTTPIKSLLRIGFQKTGVEFMDTELADMGPSTVLVLDNRDMLKFIYSKQRPFNKYLATHDASIYLP